MKKQYKVIKITNNWSLEKLRKKVESTLNEWSQKGWEVTNISYIANQYTAMITIAK